ncbi:MAG: sensor histidine kinase [Solirubrobacteraceae bacterium]
MPAPQGIGIPAPTIRLRLTLTYGVVFLLTGVVLLTIGYLLVRHNIGRIHYRQRATTLGLPPALLPRPPGLGPSSPEVAIALDLHRQLVAGALHRLLAEYVGALGLMTMVAAATGWLLAGRALRPLREITATARRVSGENLGERIGLAGPADELKELADTFDGMLGRLDGAFASQRHFVANASHELRTPLAIMRTEVDVALAAPDASSRELRGMGEAVRETIDRCEALIEGLLVLARSQAAGIRQEPVDLAALAADCITDLHALVQVGHLDVRAELDPAWVSGDPALLERMIANLLDNGIRHNEAAGYLELSTEARDGRVRLRVRNGGPVIDPAQAPALLEPFRRLDRGTGGFGLGLSIVSSVAHAHGGQVGLTAPSTGGLEVRVDLPALSRGSSVPVKSRALTKT